MRRMGYLRVNPEQTIPYHARMIEFISNLSSKIIATRDG